MSSAFTYPHEGELVVCVDNETVRLHRGKGDVEAYGAIRTPDWSQWSAEDVAYWTAPGRVAVRPSMDWGGFDDPSWRQLFILAPYDEHSEHDPGDT